MIVDYEQYLGVDISDDMDIEEFSRALDSLDENLVIVREKEQVVSLFEQTSIETQPLLIEKQSIEQIEGQIIQLKATIKPLQEEYGNARRTYEDAVKAQNIIFGITGGAQPPSPLVAAILDPLFNIMREFDMQIVETENQIDTLQQESDERATQLNMRVDELRTQFFDDLDNYMKFEEDQAIGSPTIKKR